MKKALIFLLAGWLLCAQAMAAEEYKSTLKEQKSVAVTVYNNDLGLIKDVRTMQFAPGTRTLQFMDVASRINPVTVHMKSLTSPDKFSVLEQNYEYDLLNPQKLLDKYVGKDVKIIEKNEYTGKEKTYTAKVLSNNNGPIFQIGDEIRINTPGTIVFPKIPDNLIAKPTLVWLVRNKEKKPQDIEVSYLTSGINWKCDYVAVVNAADTKADLNSWVTIDNHSGASYNNARIKLVAGDVNRVLNQSLQAGARTKVMAQETDSMFRQEAFFEYHLYSLKRPSTIKNNQTKQIELFSTANIPVRERLVYYGVPYYYRSRQIGQFPDKGRVNVFLEIENSKAHNLGMPLPAGIVRVYKKDSEGSLEFIGEDHIDHTPKDEKIRIKMGTAFDVVAFRKQTDYRALYSKTGKRFGSEQEWQITVRNHKEKTAEVEIIEPIPGDWQILSSSQKFEKTDAHTVKFVLKLKKNSAGTIKYRMRIRY